MLKITGKAHGGMTHRSVITCHSCRDNSARWLIQLSGMYSGGAMGGCTPPSPVEKIATLFHRLLHSAFVKTEDIPLPRLKNPAYGVVPNSNKMSCLTGPSSTPIWLNTTKRALWIVKHFMQYLDLHLIRHEHFFIVLILVPIITL